MDKTLLHGSRVLLGSVTGLIVAMAMVLVVGGSELTARLVEPKPVAGPDVVQRDPHLGSIPRPGTWRAIDPEFTNDWSIDSLTMNDREVTDDDLHKPVRVLSLGDSHTFAVGVSTMQTWPKRLEARLPTDKVVV